MSLQEVMDEEQSEVLAKKLQQEETGQLPQKKEDRFVNRCVNIFVPNTINLIDQLCACQVSAGFWCFKL